MRTRLTRRVFRQLSSYALYIDLRCPSVPFSHRCLHQRPSAPASRPLFHVQTRTLFGFSRKPKRKAKPANYEPGYNVLLELDERLRMGIRPPPAEEVAEAFKKYVKYKKWKSRWLEEVQVEQMKTAFLYLEAEQARGSWEVGLSPEDVATTFTALRHAPPLGYRSQAHVALSKLLFEGFQNTKGEAHAAKPVSEEQDTQFKNIFMAHIEVLSHYGNALQARDLVEQNWSSNLKDATKSPWLVVIKGMIREGQGEEVEKTITSMQKHNVPFDAKLRDQIVIFYTRDKEDLAMTKHWYYHPVAGSQLLSNQPTVVALQLCIRKNEFEWGDKIFKSLLERSPDDKASWDMILCWAAAKGRGVDEVERMMEVNIKRNKDRPNLHPNMATFNGLADLANSKNDPYTAERYIALGEKRGFQPDANTYLLQLDYRIKVNDLAGAMVAYGALQGEDLSNVDYIPHVNRFICALCALRSQDYDTIMSLVEDLTERKAAFFPETVAALSKLHLQRNEMDDLADLLNTHIFHFGLSDRETTRSVLMRYILNPLTLECRAWETYNILHSMFSETNTESRVELMQSFFARGRPDMATHVFGHMRQAKMKSQRPTTDTYATCLEGIAKAGDVESLETVHNMMKLDSEIEPNTKLYNALMLAYAGCEDPKRALEFWDDIMHSREGPTYGSIQIALKACEKAPFGDRVARAIWHRLKKSEIEVTKEIYAAYIGALAGQGLFDECVRLCEGAEKEGARVDALTLGSFYNAIPGNTRKQKVKQWAWEAYPRVYEELMKCGMYEVIVGDPDDEEQQEVGDKEFFFDIRSIGGEATP
ncbi:MAG: hypothetical protein Q9163_001644 [Psora crenata]